MHICSNCVKEESLIEFLNESGELTELCNICNSSNVKTVDVENPVLIQAVRALTRYYIDEWEYNTHMGGDNILTLFFREKPIFSDLFYANDDEAGNILDVFFADGYYLNNEGVSIYFGFVDDFRGMFEAIQHSSSQKIFEITSHAKKKSYFELLNAVSQIIDYSETHILSDIEDLELYRARIGIQKEGYTYEGFEYRQKKKYLPFSDKSIEAPPIQFVSKGRMNREGFSFLYLAEDANTAIHEVKPSPGDLVSIGKFKQNTKIKIADFTKIKISQFWSNDETLDIYTELLGIMKFISNPVGSNNSIQYLYTQLISEELIKRGFEGIKFRSSITGASNYSIFNPSRFDYVQEGRMAINISQFNLVYEDLPLLTLNQRVYGD